MDPRVAPAPIVGVDPDMDLVRGGLRVVDLQVPVRLFVQHAAVEQVEWGLEPIPAAVLLHQLAIGEGRLGILVEVAQVAVRRGGVAVEVVLLDVLAPVALVARQAECALLQDRVLAVPEGQREAQILGPVAESPEAVLAPAVGP